MKKTAIALLLLCASPFNIYSSSMTDRDRFNMLLLTARSFNKNKLRQLEEKNSRLNNALNTTIAQATNKQAIFNKKDRKRNSEKIGTLTADLILTQRTLKKELEERALEIGSTLEAKLGNLDQNLAKKLKTKDRHKILKRFGALKEFAELEKIINRLKDDEFKDLE